jgi:hypothetical protein
VCHVANLQAAPITVHITVSINHTSMSLRRFHILQIIIRSNDCTNNCEIPNDGPMSPKHVGVLCVLETLLKF